jgi:hypothetical protein
MSGYYLLFVAQSFFWTNNEIHQSIAWMFLGFGYVLRRRAPGELSVKHSMIFMALLIFSVVTHPLVIVPLVFLWVFFLLDGDQRIFIGKQTILYGGLLLVFIGLKLWLSSNQDYDGRRMFRVLHLRFSDVLNVWQSQNARLFFSQCLNNYWSGILLLIASVAIMLRQKKYLCCLWVLASMFALVLMVCISFPQGYYLYYLEGEWQSLGIMIMTPVVFYLLPVLKPGAVLALVSTLWIVRIGTIISVSGIYTHRIEYISGMIKKMRDKGLTKVVLKAREDWPEPILFMEWGLATESTTLSALEGDYPQKTMCALWPHQPERFPVGNKEMVWNFDRKPAELLNPYYFSIDTTQPYKVMSYEELMK